MGFFEFFFSGPDWGWRLFGLLCLIYGIGCILTNLFELFVTYLLCRKAIDEGVDFEVNSDDKESNEGDHSANINDVRS